MTSHTHFLPTSTFLYKLYDAVGLDCITFPSKENMQVAEGAGAFFLGKYLTNTISSCSDEPEDSTAACLTYTQQSRGSRGREKSHTVNQ